MNYFKEQTEAIFKFINDNLRALNKTRIGLMTIQLATTVRNTTNGYVRNYIYGLNNLNSGLVRGGMGKVMEALVMNKLKKQELSQ